MEPESLGRLLILVGVGITITGGIIWGLGRIGVDGLPGSLRFDIGNVSCFVPLLGMIVASVILTLVLNLIIRFLNR